MGTRQARLKPSSYVLQVLHKPLSQAVAIFTSLWLAGCDVGLTHAQLALHERVLHDDLVGACLLVDACPSLLAALDDKVRGPRRHHHRRSLSTSNHFPLSLISLV